MESWNSIYYLVFSMVQEQKGIRAYHDIFSFRFQSHNRYGKVYVRSRDSPKDDFGAVLLREDSEFLKYVISIKMHYNHIYRNLIFIKSS